MAPIGFTLAELPRDSCAIADERLSDWPAAVEWLIWQVDDQPRALKTAQVHALLQRGVAAADLPWQPLTLVPATRSLADVAADLRVPVVAVTGSAGEIQGVIPAERLLTWTAAAYRRLQAQHETTLAAVNDAITIISDDRRVIGFNWAAERIYGVRTPDILGQPDIRFFDPDRQWAIRVLKTGERVRQIPHQPKDDVHVIINSLPIVVDGQIIGAVSAEQDVTQSVRLQSLLADANSRMASLESEVGRLRQIEDPYRRIIGRSAQREHLIARVRKVAGTAATALVRGESGVGKELVARAIHEASDRAAKSFIAINCGAIPPALFESELFGYEGGAFTGADKRGKPGRLEQADGGTLFLDEVGDLPLDMQVKLLRVLEERKFYRVGATNPRTVNVRFVAATNRDLDQLIEQGAFRKDLFYRLRVVTIDVPPLRERREDLPDLIHQFLGEFSLRYRRSVQELEPGVMSALLRYEWPGNIRELRNVCEQVVVLTDDGVVQMESLPEELLRARAALPLQPALSPPLSLPAVTPVALQQPADPDEATAFERNAMRATLAATRGNRAAAARLLGLSRPTLYAKLKRLGLF